MTTEEKLQLIEQALRVEPNTLMEDALLEGIPEWDSLNVLNLQIELTAIYPNVSFDDLYECESIGDILDKMA